MSRSASIPRADRIASVVAPIVLGLAFLALWQWFVVARDIKPFLLPRPTAIWSEFWDSFGNIRKATRVTATNAFFGLVAGSISGAATALVATRFRRVGEMLTPLAAAANAIPIVAMAAIFGRMFDSTTETPRRLVVLLVVFFPVFINVLRGLREVEPVHLELMRSLAASPSAVSRRVRIPNAIPFFLTGLRVASALCVIAALVSEYFVGQQNGLGPKIAGAAKGSSNYPLAWAFVVAACALGVSFYLVAILLERVALPWRRRPSR